MTKSVVLCQQTTGPREGVNVSPNSYVRACACEGETGVLTCAGGRSGDRDFPIISEHALW
jgi:hypothetical protein